MPDYNKGKIYTIRSKTDDTLIYVGSTIQQLSVRIGGHKIKSRDIKYQNRLIYKTINNNWDNWYIELYEEYPCENKEQLCKREGEVIREIGTLNVVVAGRTRKEYREENKEQITEHKKEYYENNKEQITDKHKIYYEENKDKILNYAKDYGKIYYEQNKDKILLQKKERITCECGIICNKSNLSIHKKSPQHIQLLDPLNIN
jgi:hypothetical protein